MKLCIDCQHHLVEPTGGPEFLLCNHPDAVKIEISVVTGVETVMRPYCSVERKEGLDDCGPDATLWEPKEEVRDIDDAADRAEAETQHHTEVNDAALTEGRHK